MSQLAFEELDRKFTQLEEMAAKSDMPFIMSCGTDLCVDGHFTKEQLIELANKILEVFGDEREDTTQW